MNALIHSVLSTNQFDSRQVSEFTAAEVREAISALVAEDKTALADALCEAGLSLHPGDENILSMAALMANLRQDWARSEQYLRELMDIPGASATETAPRPARPIPGLTLAPLAPMVKSVDTADLKSAAC